MEAAFRAYESWLVQYKRVWRGTLTTSVVNPVLYLAALGIGLGSLVNRNGNAPGGTTYLHFVAPGLLAAAVMQVAAQESSWPVSGAIRWTRVYLAQLATPLGVRDVMLGHQLFVAMRVVVTGAIYLGVIAAFGAVRSPYAVFVVPSALLIGTAFSGPIAAYAAHFNSDNAFNPLFRFGVVPIFLFSGTFFPVSRLPLPLEWLAYATPLWHGVALCRDLTLGTVTAPADVGHAVYLLLWTFAGLWLAERAYRRRLVR
jgi:lipooligosaccharide transport system permease protein